MAFRLPAQNNPLRALFDLDHLAKFGTRELVVTMYDARVSARRVFETSTAQSVAYIIVTAAGDVVLLSFERNRDHHKILWNFGKAWEPTKI